MKTLFSILVLCSLLYTSNSKAIEPAQSNANDTEADPTRRRPASYIGGSLNYGNLHTWLDSNDDHAALYFGPLHSFCSTFRVGDALRDYLALGFQIQFINGKTSEQQISAFALLLDVSLYPVAGLGLRPSAGFGFGFAQGEDEWEFGFGGPGTLSFSILYEFQLTKKFSLAPVATTTWIRSDGYDGMFFLLGIESGFWLPNKKRYN